MVFGMKVKFHEKLGSMKFIQEIINTMDGEFLFDGSLIESLKIKIHVSIMFLL